MSVAELFKEQFAPGCFKRVGTKHPLDIYIGMDEENHYALEFRGNFTPQTIKSSNAISIRQYETNEFASLMFSLVNSDMLDNFCVFCDDIIESTKQTIDEKKGYKLIINRFYSWKKMFQAKPKEMDPSKIMGLIGELLFLRDFMIPKYGCSVSIRSWSGSELTHKDFSLESSWYEVKAVSVGKNTVRISSLEQLQSHNNGELVIFQLEKMSPTFDGLNLNKLAGSILKEIDSDETKEIFINKLVDAGFAFEAVYSEYVYNLILGERYKVNSDFPKLTTEDVKDAIANAQYDLIISQIQDYKLDWDYGNR